MERTEPSTNSDILQLLSERLKDYRLAARMSQKELAEQSGVGRTTISHFEQGVSGNMTLNKFLRSHKIVKVDKEPVTYSDSCC